MPTTCGLPLTATAGSSRGTMRCWSQSPAASSVPSSATRSKQRQRGSGAFTAPELFVYQHGMTEPHVLIVDDERDILDPLAAYLGRNGFRVSKARDAAAAREILAAHSIDIALIDIMMPGEDGLALTGFIRATIGTPVILLTAKAEETDRIVGLELGADDYVSKPFSPRELVARIKAVLRRGAADRVKAPDAEAYAFAGWVLRTGGRELVSAN